MRTQQLAYNDGTDAQHEFVLREYNDSCLRFIRMIAKVTFLLEQLTDWYLSRSRVNKHVDDIRAAAVLNLAVVKAHVVGPRHITDQQIAIR